MNHTPGPWTIEEWEDNGDGIPESYIMGSKGWANSGTQNKRTIAIVGHWKDRPHAEADANLISAAPDLLAACYNARGAYRALKDEGADLYLPGYKSCLEKLNAAIAKAEGKSQ